MIDANFYNNISLKIIFLRHRQFTNAMSVNTHFVHSHNLIYVYQGKGIFQIDDKEYIVPANSIVYYPPKHYQKISTLRNQSLYYHTVKFKAATISEDDSETGLEIFDESFNLPFYHTYTDAHTANERL